MLRIFGLTIVIVSMIMFALGAQAVPTANQWIADDCGFKTNGFLAGGIISMFVGATLAYLGGRAETRNRPPVVCGQTSHYESRATGRDAVLGNTKTRSC